ncbi:MAG TPA: hypothetical protein VI934_01230 [Candidatus Nanoarchaeia archaeon]|nr:hypothetical protein [Candidatus Nanoarchaeia archaeon]
MEGQTQAEQTSKIALTYEALFDLVVREKGRDDLQSLHPNFFEELVNYLGEKRSMMNLLSAEEKEKAARQLQNINRLIKELYERREKKILSFALARSRAGADIVDTSVLLAEEKSFFERMVSQMDLFRDSVLKNLLAAKTPNISQHSLHDANYSQTGAETLAAASRIITEQPTGAISGTNFSMAPKEAAQEGNATRLVRFLHPVPRFVGRELEVYGPFDQEDVANLPREIAEVLITKGRAEEIAQA